MKKFLLFSLVLVFTCFHVKAKKLFVEMEFIDNSIKLDDGSNKEAQPIKGKDGKNLKFKTLIGALNYMSLQGWELVDTKSVTYGSGYIGNHGGTSSTDTNVYYIFSKDISDEELQQIVDNSYKSK
ncbi:MAG: hypothetical protein HDS54_09855 [Barnesiella sp.]|nr:hypothetical protein [Barnesiella sp.]